jgi:tRNA(Ile2) C34 agmatinyltransferase TiaS
VFKMTCPKCQQHMQFEGDSYHCDLCGVIQYVEDKRGYGEIQPERSEVVFHQPSRSRYSKGWS